MVSQRKALMEAANSLPPTFTDAELIVAAWKLAPESLGLKGFPYPDSHKCRCVLDGGRGLVRQGKLVREDGLLRLAPTPLSRLKTTIAHKLYSEGRKAEITRFDAMRFWNCDKFKTNKEAIEATARLVWEREDVERRVLGALHDYLCGRFYDILCDTLNGRAKSNKTPAKKPRNPKQQLNMRAG